MLAKFVHWTDGNMETRHVSNEVILEVKRVNVGYKPSIPDTDVCIQFEQSDGEIVDLQVDGLKTDLFLMNNEGRTVESWRWSEKLWRQRKAA